ncbi:MAG: 4'-phosphopantetheinyl transferase superfamily protein [Hamadaea sp.]|nr:4'-phosphopantetheinyl transferase superfamily protein [Hamadaea sp.]NUR47397.1 4'-phosphopantetheinyl transferase superfamily protein [Hamadaea sp.]NUT03527.1 4'-phosphopantetheinyl transferase superfamily protein [Hamadaea sp.]
MIERILPPDVVAVEAVVDTVAEPHPDEAALVARAVPRRRQEFVTTRQCARQALARLGCPPVAIGTGPRGEPLWPDGVVGSLTHCAGYRAAVVARAVRVSAVGIDAEPNEPLAPGVLDAVSSSAERADLARYAGVCVDRLLFSAKESVYKAWFPAVGTFLDFGQASLRFTADGAFTAELAVSAPEREASRAVWADGRPRGRWMVAGGLVLTAVVAGGHATTPHF